MSVTALFVIAGGVAYALPSPYGLLTILAGSILFCLLLYFNPTYRFFRLASAVAMTWLAVRGFPNVVVSVFSPWLVGDVSIEGDLPWSFDVAAGVITLGLAVLDKDLRNGATALRLTANRNFSPQTSTATGSRSQSTVIGDVTGDGNQISIVNNSGETDFNAKIDQAAAFLKERKPDIVIVLLNQLRRDCWDRLNDREKYRVEANLGHAHHQKDEADSAAKHFLEARSHQPNDSDAAGLEAIAYHLLGKDEKAERIADEVISDHPRCVEAWTVKIASKTDLTSTSQLHDSVPVELRNDISILFALACSASIRRELESAVEFSRRLHDKLPDNFQFKMSLGSALANLAIDGHIGRRELEASECERMAEEARTLLSDVLASDGQTRLTRSHALYHRGLACEVLNKPDQAESDIRAGVDERPDDGELNYQLCVFLIRHDKYDQAIEHFDKSNCDNSRTDPGLLLSRLLFSRNTPTDRDRAEELLIGLLNKTPNVDDRLTFEAVEILARELAQASFEPRAREILETYANRLGDSARLTIDAEIHLVTGEAEQASEKAKQAFESLIDSTPPVVKYFLGKTLADVELDEEASQVLREVVETAGIDHATELLLKTAWTARDYEFVLRFTGKLRMLGRSSLQSVEMEILALEVIHEFDEALDRINDYLSSSKDEAFSKYLRLKRSWIGKWLEDESLVSYDTMLLPSLSDCAGDKKLSLTAVCGVAHLLVEGPNPQDGFELAYQLVREHFNNSIAHQCLIGAWKFGTRVAPTERDRVDTNSAVAISTSESSKIEWRVIEIDAPIGPLQEIAHDSYLAKQLIGKGVGETVNLSNDDLYERTGTVEAFLDKVDYRVRDSTNNWSSRFGDDGFLRSFSFKKPNGELDVDAFFEVQEKLHEPLEAALRAYKTDIPSIGLFSRMTRRSPIETLGFLASNSDCHIQCCNGNVKEKEHAENAMASGRPIVLGPSALATLFLLSAHRRIPPLSPKCIVSSGTLDTVRSVRRNPDSRFHSKRFVGVQFGQRWVEERTDSQIQAGLTELSDFIDWVRAGADIRGGRGIFSINRQAREQLREFFGTAVVESIGTAIATDAVFCSDDPITVMIDAQTTPVDRVWTSMYLKHLHRAGLFGKEIYHDSLIQLIQSDYRFIPLDQEMVNRVGQRKHWNAEEPEFRSIIEWLHRSGVVDAAPVAAFIIQRTWESSSLASIRTNVLSAVVLALEKRRDGIAVLRQLDAQIRQIFRGQPDTIHQIRSAIRRAEERELADSPIILPGDPDYSIPNFRFK